MIREDILDVAGSLQLCAGQMAGSRAAIYAIRQSFEKEENEALILAFNLNWQVSLRTINWNTYRFDYSWEVASLSLLKDPHKVTRNVRCGNHSSD